MLDMLCIRTAFCVIKSHTAYGIKSTPHSIISQQNLLWIKTSPKFHSLLLHGHTSEAGKIGNTLTQNSPNLWILATKAFVLSFLASFATTSPVFFRSEAARKVSFKSFNQESFK